MLYIFQGAPPVRVAVFTLAEQPSVPGAGRGRGRLYPGAASHAPPQQTLPTHGHDDTRLCAAGRSWLK